MTIDVEVPAVAEVQARVVGREREIELILAAVATGRDLILEGPPGTSKTTLLKAITDCWGIPLVFAEGNAEMTPGRLLGHHDPSRVLTEGYTEGAFEPGPLVRAMREGGFLYLEEFNRASEDTLNVLLTAIADRKVAIPRYGLVEAAPSFRLIGSMNPDDTVGTTRLSVSIRDRLCRLTIDYQDAEAERAVVALRCGVDGPETGGEIADDAVAVTRMTRTHPELRQGSSVRGAIDLTFVARRLGAMRGIEAVVGEAYREAFFEAMLVALSGRVIVDEASELDTPAVLRQIWDSCFAGRDTRSVVTDIEPEPGEEPTRRSAEPGGSPNRRRRPKQLTEDPNLLSGSGGKGLAADPFRRASTVRPSSPRQAPTSFGDDAAELDEEGESARPDLQVRAAARQIAERLALARPQPRRRPPRGAGEIVSLPYRAGADELDLDRTFEVLAERRPLAAEELIVREERRLGRAIVLVVDVSGSMRGERLRTAAAAVGALADGLGRDRLAVIAFWSDAAVLSRFDERPSLESLVDALLGLDAAGLTNVAFPLEYARRELGRVGDQEKRVLLLSDCVHNAGPDPRRIAAQLPRLDVLFDVSGGERDREMAADLARAGRGRVVPVTGYRDVAAALGEVFVAVD